MNITPATVAAGAVAAVLFYLLLKNEAKEAAVAVGDAINPVNPNNIFYGGVSAVGEVISGEKGWTLGGWIYEVTHSPDQEQ